MNKPYQIQMQMNHLLESFEDCVDFLNQKQIFSGPSLYFHQRSIHLLHQYTSVKSALDDRYFAESIYATLASWGMHRMGKGGSKLVDFQVFFESLQHLAPEIEELQLLRMASLGNRDITSVSEKLWGLVSHLRVSATQTKIVAASKALHHVLPELIPPIDREYTSQFFFHNKNLHIKTKEKFKEMFSYFCAIANQKQDVIERLVAERRGMNTSSSKVIDNAIVGYILKSKMGKLELISVDNGVQSEPAVQIHRRPDGNLIHAEQILIGVAHLLNEGKTEFSRKDVRDCIGIPQSEWNASYNPTFQGMRDDQPGGAPPVAKEFQNLFHRKSFGIYQVTTEGRQKALDLGYIKN